MAREFKISNWSPAGIQIQSLVKPDVFWWNTDSIPSFLSDLKPADYFAVPDHLVAASLMRQGQRQSIKLNYVTTDTEHFLLCTSVKMYAKNKFGKYIPPTQEARTTTRKDRIAKRAKESLSILEIAKKQNIFSGFPDCTKTFTYD